MDIINIVRVFSFESHFVFKNFLNFLRKIFSGFEKKRNSAIIQKQI